MNTDARLPRLGWLRPLDPEFRLFFPGRREHQANEAPIDRTEETGKLPAVGVERDRRRERLAVPRARRTTRGSSSVGMRSPRRLKHLSTDTKLESRDTAISRTSLLFVRSRNSTSCGSCATNSSLVLIHSFFRNSARPVVADA